MRGDFRKVKNMMVLSEQEQKIFENIMRNANFIMRVNFAAGSINSRQLESLARAVAVELAGLERSLWEATLREKRYDHP